MLEFTPRALEAVETLFCKFGSVLAADLAHPPDLHLVIVEAPTPYHLSVRPLPPLRPDLLRKPLIDHWPDTIPTLPAMRFLYFGDARWLEPFQQLSRETTEVFRAHDPEIDQYVTGATWEGDLFFMPNLWPRLIRDILMMSGTKGFIRRWRWGDDPYTQFLPYDDDELKAWKESERGLQCRSIPSKEVNVTMFTHNIFECSCTALDWTAFQIREKLKPTRPPDPAGTTEAKPVPKAPRPGPAASGTEPPAGFLDRVTLDQAAAAVHRKKRTLEHYKTKGTLPAPTILGGGGKPALWDWKALRPWLESTFKIELPETYPAHRNR
jgi:hypothetical protein